jgi:hypothetical protein
MGSQKCRIVGESQPVLVMINPIIFTRACMWWFCTGVDGDRECLVAVIWIR